MATLLPVRVTVRSFEEVRRALQRIMDNLNRMTVGSLVADGNMGEGGAAGSPSSKGDILVSDANQEFSLLNAGVDGYVLTADSSQALGLKWSGTSKVEVFTGSAPGVEVVF